MKKKMENTGYWRFNCNPKQWNIDEFLNNGETESWWMVTETQLKHFKNKEGQKAYIRVGKGKQILKPGIYAVVEVMSKPEEIDDDKCPYWNPKHIEKSKEKGQWRVKVKYTQNLISNPLYLDDITTLTNKCDENKILKGLPQCTLMITKQTFEEIARLIEKNNATH